MFGDALRYAKKRYPQGGLRLILGSIVWVGTNLFALGVGIMLIGGAGDDGSTDTRIAGAFLVLIALADLAVYFVMLRNLARGGSAGGRGE